jgi:hypothetical protein
MISATPSASRSPAATRTPETPGAYARKLAISALVWPSNTRTSEFAPSRPVMMSGTPSALTSPAAT